MFFSITMKACGRFLQKNRVQTLLRVQKKAIEVQKTTLEKTERKKKIDTEDSFGHQNKMISI